MAAANEPLTSSSQTIYWTSRLGFIMASAGSAVGVGNLQRFPQLVAQHGGGAFLLLYLGCIISFGLPVMLAELALGRAAGTAPIHTFTKVAPSSRLWRYIGVFSAFIAFAILSYYTVICAWTLSFVSQSFNTTETLTYDLIASQSQKTLPFLCLFYFVITVVTRKGLNNGVEKFNKFVMPALFVIQGILIIKVLSLPNSFEGLRYYLYPDFSKLKPDSLFVALSQSFFSLCIGEGVLLTYGSFANKRSSLPQSALYIVLIDTCVAFFAGLIIIPAAYLSRQNLEQGIGLTYNTLLTVFQSLRGGQLYLILYFTILAIAGLTTCITLLDVASQGLSQLTHLPKRSITLYTSLASFALSIPCLYSKGGIASLSNLTLLGNQGLCDIMDFLWGNMSMVICGLLITIFVGWIWGSDQAIEELSHHSPFFQTFKKPWSLHIRWIVPLIIIYILCQTLLS